MFNTIKTQLSLVITLLIALLIMQLWLSNENQKSDLENSNQTQLIAKIVNTVGAIERDLNNLQRNLLIFKETASPSIQSKFINLTQEIDDHLRLLSQQVAQQSNEKKYQELITRMKVYLDDYKEHFEHVIQGRKNRDQLLQTKVYTYFEQLSAITKTYQLFSQYSLDKHGSHSSLVNATNDDDSGVQTYSLGLVLLQVKTSGLKYLLTNKHEDLQRFTKKLSISEALIRSPEMLEAHSAKGEVATKLLNLTSTLKLSFTRLQQITRGYTYLVNVVMAGTANEFLYLTSQLRECVHDDLMIIEQDVEKTFEQTQKRNYVFVIVSLLLTLLLVFIFILRVVFPIRQITEMFQCLAQGGVFKAPEQEFKSIEINELASIGETLNLKNEQHKSLEVKLTTENKTLQLANERLNQLIIEAEDATKSKSMFLANMSHEIRTPMNGIIGLVEYILHTDLSDEQFQTLKKVAYSSQMLMGVINDILDFSKIEAGKLTIENEKFNTNDVFDTLLSNINMLAKDRGLVLNFNVDPTLPTMLIGDSLRFTQILFNLCTNAIKFTPAGSVSVDFNVNEKNKDTLELSLQVSDTGIGISPIQQQQIFKAFNQADGSTSRKYGGTGLGLSIVQSLVELMGGTITCDSKENVGTCFTVNLTFEYSPKTPLIISSTGMHRKKIHYFGYINHPYISNKYLKATQIPVEFFNINAFKTFDITNVEESELIIVDVHSMRDINLFNNKLESLPQLRHNIIICAASTLNLDSVNLENEHVTLLSLPESPAKIASLIANSKEVDGEKHPHEEQVIPLYHGHILLVEDNVINQMVAGKILTAAGLTFDCAENGEQGVEMYKSNPKYDLILMDIQMPVMDGYTATEKLRELGDDIVICGLSANAMQADQDKAFDVGMDDYITKPIQQKSLTAVFERFLTKRTNT